MENDFFFKYSNIFLLTHLFMQSVESKQNQDSFNS